MTLMQHMFACAPRVVPTLDIFVRGVAENGARFVFRLGIQDRPAPS
jgi:hypothetical protein